MGAIKAVTIITGEDASARPQTIAGLEVQTLHADPVAFTVSKDTTATPPRVVLGLAAAVTSGLNSRVTALENGETAVAQAWAADVVPVYEAGQRTRQLVDLTPLNNNMIIKGPAGDGLVEGHTYTLIVNASATWSASLDTNDWKGDLPLGLTGAADEKMVVQFVWTGAVPVVVAAYSGTVA